MWRQIDLIGVAILLVPIGFAVLIIQFNMRRGVSFNFGMLDMVVFCIYLSILLGALVTIFKKDFTQNILLILTLELWYASGMVTGFISWERNANTLFK